mgnify:CR=1 FL=1
MARNGSGVYSNPYPNFVAGTTISSDQVDANNTQMATALTQSIAVDGQSTVTGNIPMSSKKFTGLAVGSASTDSLTLGQAQAEAFIWCGTMTGSADAGALSPTPAITAYAAGQRFAWKASTSANTGAMTVAISGLSTIAVQNDRAALAAGIHAASDIFMGILDTASTIQIMKVANDATAGDVVGPSSATNNSLAKYDGTTGKLLKNGAVIGTDVQAYDADTTKNDVANTFSKAQRGSITALTDASSIATDMALNNFFSVTLGGNRALANPTNIVAGQSGSFFITQDGTGSRTLSYGSYFDFVGGTAPTLTTTASAVDRVDYIARTTTSLQCVWSGALS